MEKLFQKITIVFIYIFLVVIIINAENGANFIFSGKVGNEIKFNYVNRFSLVNKDDILDLSPWNYITNFNISGRGQLYFDFFNYYFKIRGEMNFHQDFDFFRDDELHYNGKSYFSVDEFYFDIAPIAELFILLGKERISWGSGMIYNPIDVINPQKAPDMPWREEEGIYTFHFEVIPVTFFNFILYYSPDFVNNKNEFEYLSSNLAARFNFFFHGVDLSLYYYEQFKYDQTPSVPKIGMTINYAFLFGLNLYTDVIYERYSDYTYFNDNHNGFNKTGENYFSVLGGVSYVYQGNFDFTVMLEYYYNAKGCSIDERVNYFERLESYHDELDKIDNKEGPYQFMDKKTRSDLEQMNKGMILQTSSFNNFYYLNQHYLGIQVRFGNIANLVDINTLFSMALLDQSFFMKNDFDFNILDNFVISVFFDLFIGQYNQYSQFGNTLSIFDIGAIIKFIF